MSHLAGYSAKWLINLILNEIKVSLKEYRNKLKGNLA